MRADRVEAVFFDLDDTLLDHSAASEVAVRARIALHRPDLDPSGHDAALDEWRRLEHLHYPAYLRGEISVDEQRRRRARGLLEYLGADPIGPAGLDRWFAEFLDSYRGAWAPFDDVLPLLDALADRVAAMGVVTNAIAELQRRKLAALGLERRLVHLIASSEVGVAKPSPEIFAAAAFAVGVPPARVAYVGDRLDTDARGARDAGMVGVWLNRDPERADATDVPTIRSLAELPALI
jgi:putative hydrolase of the HAD superfamily